MFNLTKKKKIFFPQSGKLEFVQSLMDFDPKLLVKDKLGNTPLHYAAQKYPEVVNSLLKKGHELGMLLIVLMNYFKGNIILVII